MKSFKTPKGTELPLSNIKGKDYLTVAYRIVWFREEHPDWTIKTECVDMNDQSCLFRAEISYSGTLVSSAHKREHKAHFGDFEEKAETGAIGRALANCGYGTQFAPELHEGDRIVDSPVDAPAKEEYQDNQHSTALVSEAQIKRLFAIAKKHNWSNDKVKEFMFVRYQIDSTKDLNRFNYDHLIGQIEATK